MRNSAFRAATDLPTGRDAPGARSDHSADPDGTHRRPRVRLALGRAAAVLLLAGPLATPVLEAQNRKSESSRSTSAARPSAQSQNQARYRSGPRYRADVELKSPPSAFGSYYQHKARGGFGSAANVRPGHYQQFGAQTEGGRGNRHSGRAIAPIVIGPPIVHGAFDFSPRPVVIEQTVNTPPPQTVVVQAPPPQIVYVERPAPSVETPSRAAAPTPAAPVQAPRPSGPVAPGEVAFAILPLSAAVFLDDDYIGTGAELAGTRTLTLDPAVYFLEVEHPDLPPERLMFAVGAEAESIVEIDLNEERPSRRVRIR